MILHVKWWPKLRSPVSSVLLCSNSLNVWMKGIGLQFHLFTAPSACAFCSIVDLFSFLCCSRLQNNTINAAHVCSAFWINSDITPDFSRVARLALSCRLSYLCTCRRLPGPTRAGLWTAWFCSTRWPSGWRMTSPSHLQREYTCTASTSKEPVGTAVAANSSRPSPKSFSRWCQSSGCMLWTMVRFPSISWHSKEADFIRDKEMILLSLLALSRRVTENW